MKNKQIKLHKSTSVNNKRAELLEIEMKQKGDEILKYFVALLEGDYKIFFRLKEALIEALKRYPAISGNKEEVLSQSEYTLEECRAFAEQGEVFAIRRIALEEFNDYGATEARELFEEAANKGDKGSQIWLDIDKKVQEKIAELRQIAESGDVDAQLFLGSYYREFYWDEADSAECEKFLEMAAMQGVLTAITDIADYYRSGDLLEEDLDKAIYWFEQGAKRGDLWCKYCLGKIYLDDETYGEQFEKAKALFEEIVVDAEKHKDEDEEYYSCYLGKAYYYLASFYKDDSKGQRQDTARALEYYYKAQDNGKECLSEIISLEGNIEQGMAAVLQNVAIKNVLTKSGYKKVLKRLEKEFGELWNCMKKEGRDEIITGFISYALLDNVANEYGINVDYSSSIVPMAKACEIEFSRIFQEGFISYLEKEKVAPEDLLYGIKPPEIVVETDCGYKYIDKIKTAKSVKGYTLGGLKNYVRLPLNPAGWRHPVYEKMLTYLNMVFKEDVFVENRKQKICEYLQEFADKTETFAKTYRNPAAHTALMSSTKALECGNKMIMVEKLLIEFLSKIKREYLE